jgi:hypothetical protein
MWLKEGKFKWVTKWLGGMEIKELLAESNPEKICHIFLMERL